MPVDAEVLTSCGGFEALQRAAEAAFALEPETYSLHDEYGKVETDAALARAVKMVGSGEFLLEVREQPHWAKLRALEERLEQKATVAAEEEAAPDAEALHEDLERRIMARVEAALEEFRERQERVELKVAGTIGPMLQRLSAEQVSMRERLDSLAKDLEDSRKNSDDAASSTVEGTTTAAMAHTTPAQLDALEEELRALKQHLQNSHSQALGLQAEVHLTMATTNLELKKEMQCMRDTNKLAEHSFKLLQAELRQVSEAVSELAQPKATTAALPPSFSPSWSRSGISAMEEDCGINIARPLSSEGNTPIKKNLGGAYVYTTASSPFARSHAPAGTGSLPRLEHVALLKSSQSLPQLRLRH